MDEQVTLGTIIVDGEIVDLDNVPIKKLEEIADKLSNVIEEKRNEIWSQLVDKKEED